MGGNYSGDEWRLLDMRVRPFRYSGFISVSTARELPNLHAQPLFALRWSMAWYIFTRDKRSRTSWEFMEMSVRPEVAKRVLANYRSILRRQSDVEVVMIEADSIDKAKGKLESQDA